MCWQVKGTGYEQYRADWRTDGSTSIAEALPKRKGRDQDRGPIEQVMRLFLHGWLEIKGKRLGYQTRCEMCAGTIRSLQHQTAKEARSSMGVYRSGDATYEGEHNFVVVTSRPCTIHF